MNAQDIERLICKALCADTAVTSVREGVFRVTTPFAFPDGDGYSIYLQQLPSGGLRVSDFGATLMHLSYENDIDKFRDGSRGRLLQQILSDSDLSEDQGEFFIETAVGDLGVSLFRFGQALTRIHDLSFLNRLRSESTFYEDLRETLRSIVSHEQLHEQYVVPDVPRAGDYPVDYLIDGTGTPLYLFGVPNRDKARLATIILQHLIAANKDFNSMIVFQDMSQLPRADVSRLTNAANDQIDSLNAADDLRRKVLRRVTNG